MTITTPSIQLASRTHGPLVVVHVLDASSGPLTREAFLRELVSSADARTQLDRCVAEAPFEALFFEMPPLVRSRLDAPAELVLVDAPLLLRMQPDQDAFDEHLDGPGPRLRVFDNLSGDARLVAPCQDGPAESYVHLASFCRHAPPSQRDQLWQTVAEAALDRVHQRAAPLWVSTSGLGIGWLHVRLDSRPKYYSHRPYRDPAA